MDTYKKTLITFVIILAFNYLNAQMKPTVLDQSNLSSFNDKNLKTVSNSVLSNKNNFYSNYSTAPMLNKLNSNEKSLDNCTVDKTAIVKAKKSTLFELNKINGAEFSNTLYLMTFTIYRV